MSAQGYSWSGTAKCGNCGLISGLSIYYGYQLGRAYCPGCNVPGRLRTYEPDAVAAPLRLVEQEAKPLPPSATKKERAWREAPPAWAKRKPTPTPRSAQGSRRGTVTVSHRKKREYVVNAGRMDEEIFSTAKAALLRAHEVAGSRDADVYVPHSFYYPGPSGLNFSESGRSRRTTVTDRRKRDRFATNYVEGLGWLTEREAAWFESEDGYLDEREQIEVEVDTRFDSHAPVFPVDSWVRPGWHPEGREIGPKPTLAFDTFGDMT